MKNQKENEQIQKVIEDFFENEKPILEFKAIKDRILKLEEKEREEFFSFCFHSASTFENVDLLKLLLNDKDTQPILKTLDYVFSALMAAIDNCSFDSMDYLLIEEKFDWKDKDKTEFEYSELCYDLLYYAIEEGGEYSSSTTKYMIYHIHNYDYEQYGYVNNILEADLYSGFTKAWNCNNNEVLKLWVQEYELTGEEEDLKKFLKSKRSFKGKDEVINLMRINREKPMLENAIKTPQENVVKNSSKNKI